MDEKDDELRDDTAPWLIASVCRREDEAGVGHVRQVVAAEEQRREQRADDRDLDELGEHEQPHLHRAVLGEVAGDQLRLRFRQVERDALVLGDGRGQEQDRGERLVEDAPGRQTPSDRARLLLHDRARSTVP